MCTGRNADTLSRSLMFTLVISNLPGICLPVLISPQRAVDIKITAIYVISMCVGRGCGQNKATLQNKSFLCESLNVKISCFFQPFNAVFVSSLSPNSRNMHMAFVCFRFSLSALSIQLPIFSSHIIATKGISNPNQLETVFPYKGKACEGQLDIAVPPSLSRNIKHGFSVFL